jgi:chromosome segregation ATPase
VRKYVIGLVLSSILVLSGCNFGPSVEEQLSDALSDMNAAEKEYRDAQSELSKLEKSEQQLFTGIMELTQEQKEELETKVAELEKLLEQRLVHIDQEESSMKKAMELLKSFDSIIEQAEGDMKSHFEELKKAVGDRYDLHSAVVTEYKELANLQKELYEMLVTEGVELSQLKEKVGEVNAQNETVQSTINSFNEATIIVNGLKDDIFESLQDGK